MAGSRILALLEEFGDPPLTEEDLRHLRVKLEQRFLDRFSLAPADVDEAIRQGAVPEGDLVDEWIKLRAFERLSDQGGSP